MGCKVDAPKDELLRAFAPTVPAQGTWREVVAPVPEKDVKAYKRPVLHLGPPTVDELAKYFPGDRWPEPRAGRIRRA